MPYNMMSQNDVYKSFSNLSQVETRGQDYEIETELRPKSRFIIIAPHGGGIEPETSEIAKRIAHEDFSYYSFKGIKKPRGNRILHITSHNFDEPNCLELVTKHDWVIAIHGCEGNKELINIGGRENDLKNELSDALLEADFKPKTSGHKYPGQDRMNICNRGRQSAGVQFELSLPFRRSGSISIFIEIIREVLLDRQNAV